MALRTARRGRNAGGQFWGCTQYPDCRGTRNIGGSTAPAQPFRKTGLLPVEWIEGVRRSAFVPEYVSVGAIPGIFHDRLSNDTRLKQALSQCVLLSNRNRERQEVIEHARFTSALLLKLLRRGRTPLPTLNVEREGLRMHGFLDTVSELGADNTETGWELRSGTRLRVTPEAVMSAITERVPFRFDSAFGFDPGSDGMLLQSAAEDWFLNQWVPEALGETAGHWFTPQASLDTLIESGGGDGSGARRIDFLFNHPGGWPFAIEIDGPEHDAAVEVDEARDESLGSIGIDVLRVSNDEVLQGHGALLDRIRSRCEEAFTAFDPVANEDKAAASLVIDCATAAKVQVAVARAIDYGWLTADEDWEIVIRGAGAPAAFGVLDALQLLAGFDVLYGGCSLTSRCTVRADGGVVVSWTRTGGGEWVESTEPEAPGKQVRIDVESGTSPFQALPEGHPDFVIRPVYVPALIATDQSFDLRRRPVVASTYDEARSPLRMFLQNVFRKREFRPMQGTAVFNILRQNDCVVLLQTGAGKSIIYQLAGLLMPGVTLVVDPITALIEDQVEGLRAYGIDRAVPITSYLATRDERERLLRRVERGEYHFVLHSPERLQSPQFRAALRALVECSYVNLAVIDEAHCVSEWGHDFRPAYLNLANNLRRLGAGRDGSPPPLLALTGTASRAVLRDMLTDLGIDRNRSDALIRPVSFDRPELRFEIVRTLPMEDPRAALRGVLNALPGKFRLPRTEFYRPAGRDTASGIVFVPTVNARMYGVRDTRDTVQQATSSEVTMYSGSPPRSVDSRKWDLQKRENAAAFKSNRVPVLVATKAFGMGIDKPNIRYTVHFGMPMSIESFYQEAGRAGRDGKDARSSVVFSEYDASRSDALLDRELDLETLRTRFRDANGSRQTEDDVTRAIWFHLQAFSGAEQDIDDVKTLLDAIGELASSQRLDQPYQGADDRKRKEKAIYRLLRIGVIRDYEVEFGASKFVVHVATADFNRCKQRLLDYVYAVQPAMRETSLAQRAGEIDASRPHDAALALAKMLIAFTYDVVERSRRGMIQEAVLLARKAQSDSEIRKRLLDYLQEGFGAERIDQLLRNEKINLSAWWELVGKVQTEMDAGELRGLCIRALESDPDHPGLLLARSLAESMCSDHDVTVSSKEIRTAIRVGVEKYEIAQTEIETTIDAMFDLASTRARDLGPSLTIALIDLARSRPDYCAFVWKEAQKGRAGKLDDPRVRAVVATGQIRDIVDLLEQAAARVTRQYEPPEVMEALEV